MTASRWYKLTAWHGGGHQAESEKYVVLVEIDDCDDEEIRELVEDEWNHWANTSGWNQARGTSEELTEIDEETRSRLIECREMQIERIKSEIASLREIPPAGGKD